MSARSQPESTGGAGGENVNSNTIPADDVPAVQVEETGQLFLSVMNDFLKTATKKNFCVCRVIFTL